MVKQNIFAEKKASWYDCEPVISRNAVYNFICGARGIGKTYGFKKRAINDFIKRGRQFIYLRRYSEEIKKAKEAFFTDVSIEFPEYMFRVEGYLAQVKKPTDKKWRTCGHFIALSVAQQYKSVPFPNVYTVIFDEFIIDRGAVHYISNETDRFNDFYSTIDRYQDRVKCYMLSNTVSIMNPYFIDYDITVVAGTEWVSKGDGFILVHLPNDETFKNQVQSTRFGKFIFGTSYGQYAVDSHFLDNNPALIGRKPPTAYYALTIETVAGVFSMWVDESSGTPLYFIQAKRPKNELFYTMVIERMSEEKTLIHSNDRIIQRLRTAFKNGRIMFSSPTARNAFSGIFKR